VIATTATSLHHLARGDMDAHPVMRWTCPVPYFGRLGNSVVATLGINPSNREFVDDAGRELEGADRRFPTLTSLGLRTWADASSVDVAAIISACDRYFTGNPYTRWFDVLDAIVRASGASYYSNDHPAAHVDLVPYATHVKWGSLRQDQQRTLLQSGRDLVAPVLRDSMVRLLVLNGASVVREFEIVAGMQLKREYKPDWDLARRGSRRVRGVAYVGSVERIGKIDLERSVSVLGFNHNLQSSFGVTKLAIDRIGRWVGAFEL
jgi:hypothetical protein